MSTLRRRILGILLVFDANRKAYARGAPGRFATRFFRRLSRGSLVRHVFPMSHFPIFQPQPVHRPVISPLRHCVPRELTLGAAADLSRELDKSGRDCLVFSSGSSIAADFRPEFWGESPAMSVFADAVRGVLIPEAVSRLREAMELMHESVHSACGIPRKIIEDTEGWKSARRAQQARDFADAVRCGKLVINSGSIPGKEDNDSQAGFGHPVAPVAGSPREGHAPQDVPGVPGRVRSGDGGGQPRGCEEGVPELRDDPPGSGDTLGGGTPVTGRASPPSVTPTMLYRSHRGSFGDSLATVREIPATRKALAREVRADLQWFGIQDSDVVAEYQCPDPRKGWEADSYLVSVLTGYPVGTQAKAVGYCSAAPKE